MSNRSSWTPGNLNSGNIAYTAAFGATELNGLANGSSFMSSLNFDNSTFLDEFMDISVVATIASGYTLTQGASLGFWLAVLQGDGTTYGEGSTRIVAGGPAVTYFPSYPAIGGVQLSPGLVTNLAGDIGGISLRPCRFALIMQNSLTATPSNPAIATCSVWIRTYNQNLNA